MQKLELKHITPYLPYDISIITDDELKNKVSIVDAKNDVLYIFNHHYKLNWVKLLLRPMSDLFETILHNGEFVCVANLIKEDAFVLHELYYDLSFKQNALILQSLGEVMDFGKPSKLPFFVIEILFKYHFDVFGLIKKGLAKTLKTGL